MNTKNTIVINEDTPQEIATAAQRFVLHVGNRLKFKLDFTSDTLPVVDHFISDLVREESGGVIPCASDRAKLPLIHLMAPLAGAYFGEVVRSAFPARWRFTNHSSQSWRLEFSAFFLRFNPAGTAADVIAGKVIESWAGSIVTSPELTKHLRERLAAAPPLPENDFFTFATHYESIQIAEDYLKERAAKDGALSCDPHNYDKILGS